MQPDMPVEPLLFRPGFRLSSTDIAVLAAGAVGALLVGRLEFWFGLVIAFVVLHFFFFCNVFRMPRTLEFIWAALFLLLIGSTVTTQQPGWTISFVLALIGAAVLVLFQMSRPSYHGVGWRYINPQLPQWWQARHPG
jgi:hypothetical protein